jgi:predicted nucleotidyltransferase
MNKVIFKTIHGSRSYNLNNENSDLDIRGVFLPNKEEIIGLKPGKLYLTAADFGSDGKDETYWEFRHFIKGCLNANPNMLEVLFTPTEMQLSFREFDKVLKNREMFLTARCFDSFGGYAKSNLHKVSLSKDDPSFDKKEAKNASHLIRLLYFLEDIIKGNFSTFFKEGDYRLTVLRDIKDGEWHPMDVIEFANKKFEELSVLQHKLPPMSEEVFNFWDNFVQETLEDHLKYETK